MRKSSPVLLGLLLAAVHAWAMTPIAEEPTARLELAAGPDGATLPLPFFVKLGDAWAEGRVEFDHATETVRLAGIYTTAQGLDSRARLSYQIYEYDGRLLVQDGARFDWAPGDVDGERVASFRIEQSLKAMPDLRPAFRLQFNYVVENEYWHRDRFPALALPQLAIRGPRRAASFRVCWSGVPRFWPAGAEGYVPALINAEFGGPHDFRAALDIESADGTERHETPRGRTAVAGDGTKLLWYRIGNRATAESVRARPGFVWDGVAWYDWAGANPHRPMRLVGPLGYLAALTAVVWGFVAAAGWVRTWRGRGTRAAGWAAWIAGGSLVLTLTAVNGYVLLASAPFGFRLVRRWTDSPGRRAYWTVWLFGALLEFYWAHVDAATTSLWSGTVLSCSLLALLLLPLRFCRRWTSAACAGALAIGLMAVASTALAVYFDFFRDYPGLRDLLYAGQIGDVGDSLGELVGQRHIVPWWLALCACWPLWVARKGDRGIVRTPMPADDALAVPAATSRDR